MITFIISLLKGVPPLDHKIQLLLPKVYEKSILPHLKEILLKFEMVLHFIDIKMHLIASVAQVEMNKIISHSHSTLLRMASILRGRVVMSFERYFESYNVIQNDVSVPSPNGIKYYVDAQIIPPKGLSSKTQERKLLSISTTEIRTLGGNLEF